MGTSGGLSIYRLGKLAGFVALPCLAVGLYLGLVWAPPDAMMGNVQRIMYVHFPSWIATALAYLTAFVCSILYLARRRDGYDYLAQAGVEVGVLFNTTGLITGSIWGRPTWGVWWTWDPRLTTTAIMLIIFVGYLLVRAFLEDLEARARVGALVAIMGFVTLPVVYFSVRWWRTLHQPQSSPSTVDPRMVVALRTMMIAFALIAAYLMSRRYELARLQAASERLEVGPGVTDG
ncbi:MAG TPA: cytochrome c biogenesis protein CcsA [Gemmatimonadales bacterium]|nr:cytochrome c biogenesis protein CcsA [Gemmatimonadales bacterium]